MNPTPVAIRKLGDAPEPPWLDAAVQALDGLRSLRYGRRKDRLGGVLYDVVRACIEAYVRRFAAAETAPMLVLTANDLHRWRVELGVTALDRETASRALHAWHGLVASLQETPDALAAEHDGRWVIVRLRDQHHEKSHEHPFWVEVVIDDGDVYPVLGREKNQTVKIGALLGSRSQHIQTRADTRGEEEVSLGKAATEVQGFITSFVRSAGAKKLAAAYAALRQGRRDGWSRGRIFLAIAVALVTACGVWYWRVTHHSYTTALVMRSGPLLDWGIPDAKHPVYSEGRRIGYVAYNRPAPDVIRLRYFREQTAWCPKHHIVKDLLTWRLAKNGREFYRQTTGSTPWCEIRRVDLPADPLDIELSMHDGAEINIKTGRVGLVDITTLQQERSEPLIIVTATESQSEPSATGQGQSTTYP